MTTASTNGVPPELLTLLMLAERYKAQGLSPEEMIAKLVTEARCERSEAEAAIAASVAASANYGRWWGASDEAGAGERAHKASEGGSKLLAEEVPIAGLMREGVPEPAFLPSPTLGERLFYEGSLFLFAGHKKAGKSWAMTLEARDCMAAERPVVYVDNENGRELFAERLLLSGATPETVEAHFHYVPFPKAPPNTHETEGSTAMPKSLTRESQHAQRTNY
jgi:hypothetical protein